jgi:hypothetical protein
MLLFLADDKRRAFTMTAWKTSKAKQILEAIEFGRENSSQIAKRIGTSPK